MRIIAILIAALSVAAVGLEPAAAQEVKLIFATVNPAGSVINDQSFVPWAARINAQGQGVVQVDIREGSTLANYGNVYNRVLDDVIQIGRGLPDVIAGRFPLSGVAGLPFLTNSAEVGSVAMWRLYKSGVLDKEYADIMPLMMVMLSQSGFHLKVEPKKGADLGGLKLFAGSRLDGDKIARLGAAPLSLQLGDMYEGLQRGTIDGAFIGWTGVERFKLAEVTSYDIDEPLGSAAAFVFMSRKKFESLSPVAQKLLLDNSGEPASRQIGQVIDRDVAHERDTVKAGGKHTFIALTDAQRRGWRAKLEPIVDQWEANSPENKAVLTKFRALVAAAAAK